MSKVLKIINNLNIVPSDENILNFKVKVDYIKFLFRNYNSFRLDIKGFDTILYKYIQLNKVFIKNILF